MTYNWQTDLRYGALTAFGFTIIVTCLSYYLCVFCAIGVDAGEHFTQMTQEGVIGGCVGGVINICALTAWAGGRRSALVWVAAIVAFSWAGLTGFFVFLVYRSYGPI